MSNDALTIVWELRPGHTTTTSLAPSLWWPRHRNVARPRAQKQLFYRLYPLSAAEEQEPSPISVVLMWGGDRAAHIWFSHPSHLSVPISQVATSSLGLGLASGSVCITELYEGLVHAWGWQPLPCTFTQ